MSAKTVAQGAATFAAGVCSVIAVLSYQSAHHGWPFSLHHGIAPIRSIARSVPAAPVSHAGHRVAVHVADDVARRNGIRAVPVSPTSLASELRATATLVPDEARVAHVHTRVSGWIDRLAVPTTGARVRAGQTLATIFSQELLASQTEYVAVRAASPPGVESPLVRGARERLRVFGLTDAEIASIDRRGTPSRTIPILSPRTGVVVHRGVTVGTSVDPSTELFTIADFSEVWVLAEVPEVRAPDVSVGTVASLEFPASGQASFERAVTFVYPTLSEGTRTLRVRFSVENPTGTLRPGMFGTASFRIAPRMALTVPRDAVVDTGSEQHVFVETAPGSFAPRQVRVGMRTDDRVEILEGVREGERVVASGVFLLDSESRLRATGGAVGHAGHGSSSGGGREQRDDSSNTPEAAHAGHGH